MVPWTGRAVAREWLMLTTNDNPINTTTEITPMMAFLSFIVPPFVFFGGAG
jgi:hypothetical protein